MPAFTQVHGHSRVFLHVLFEQRPVFRMLLIEQSTILLAHQATGQLG